MKTIEERAENYSNKVWTNPMFAQEWEECKRDYIQGATEQREIDAHEIDFMSKRIAELEDELDVANSDNEWKANRIIELMTENSKLKAMEE